MALTRTRSCQMRDLALSILDEIAGLDPSPGAYSNPKNRKSIPFACLYPHQHTNQTAQHLYFMGRVDFWDIYHDIKGRMRRRTGEYVLRSTPGWGKSYILALLACLLMRRRKVIFIPDCQSFSGSVFHEVRLSYALAYAQDARKFQYLMEMNSWDELINFTDYEHDIGVQHIFIIDGTRAENLNYGNPSAIIAGDCRGILSDRNMSDLRRISFDQILIRSSNSLCSTDQGSRIHTDGRFFFGGLTPIEMIWWWRYHEELERLPGLLQFRGTNEYTDKEAVALRRDELQVLTGCNFHLLNAALDLKGESDTRGLSYDDFLSLLVQREPFRSIRAEVRGIAFSVGFIDSNM
ncbi:hypothetical protein TWF102_001982 [Orbilia oligospora]|uniref:Uncharacterized protein n=1 Tax=Orbilia oligospora TaxID=2813651 RepID=A0A7C8MZD9_ORBOL|nr:hypothetical protein TWF102_001982 [Orbilia oligospora]